MKSPSFKAPSFKMPSFKVPVVKRKPLPSMEKAPDPLKGMELPDEIEASAATELDAIAAGFRDRAAKEAARFNDATDTGFYTCLVFENRAQVDAFVTALGLNGSGDMYLDGREVAAKIGINIETADRIAPKSPRLDRDFERLTR
jgi:hypothetical protein